MMKFFILLILTVQVLTENALSLFTLNLSEGLSQFEDFQTSTSSAKVIDDTEKVKALTFEELSRYSGIVTTEWIQSPTQDYYITISYRGAAHKRTGAFLGYMTKEENNIVRSLALDNDQMMDYYQLQFFQTGNGTWNNYNFYLSGTEGIKLIMEKGMYFGLNENYDMAFSGLKVVDYTLEPKNCPGKGEDKLMKSYYFGKIFADDNFRGKATPEFVDHGEMVEIKFKFPDYSVPCVLSALFAFNSNGKVIESFAPSSYVSNNVFIHTYNFTLSELNDFGCKQTEVQCQNGKTTGECLNYVCPLSLHFYLDYGNEYVTRQKLYDWVNENSYTIFKSSFTVQVYKETSTVLNTLVKTLVTNKVCGDKCTLDLNLELNLKIKNSQGLYVTPQASTSVVWGDMIDFQITSNPSDYGLSLMQIFVQTGDQTGDEYIQLGEIFIDLFLQNVKRNTVGQITFSMMISGEAGLSKGKPFNLKFLIESKAASRLLEELQDVSYSSNSLPKAALTNLPVAFTISGNTEDSAYKLGSSVLLLLILFFLIG